MNTKYTISPDGLTATYGETKLIAKDAAISCKGCFFHLSDGDCKAGKEYENFSTGCVHNGHYKIWVEENIEMKLEYSGENTYVWLPKELAKLVEGSTGVEGYEKEILSFIEDSKLDMKTSIEEIDESILLYRAKMIQARDSFKKAKEEELDANYVLWETYEKDIKSTREYVDNAKKVLTPLVDEIKELNVLIKSLDIDRIESFMGSLNRLKYLMTEEKEIAELVLKFYRDK